MKPVNQINWERWNYWYGTKVAKIFNEYFANIVKSLEIITEKKVANFTENNLSEVEMNLQKNAITERMKKLCNFTFSFNFISYDDIVKELNKFKSKKA